MKMCSNIQTLEETCRIKYFKLRILIKEIRRKDNEIVKRIAKWKKNDIHHLKKEALSICKNVTSLTYIR